MKTHSAEQLIHRRARAAVQYAKLSGRLVMQPCEVCGAAEVHAHHHRGYVDPLDVQWLCKRHHQEAHANPPGQRAAAWLWLRQWAGLTSRQIGWKSGHLSLIERGLRGDPEKIAALRAFYVGLIP